MGMETRPPIGHHWVLMLSTQTGMVSTVNKKLVFGANLLLGTSLPLYMSALLFLLGAFFSVGLYSQSVDRVL